MLKLRQAKWLSQCSSPRRHWSRFWCRFRGNEYEFNTDQSVKLPRQGQQQNTIPVTIVDYSPMKMHWIYPVYHSTFVTLLQKWIGLSSAQRQRQSPTLLRCLNSAVCQWATLSKRLCSGALLGVAYSAAPQVLLRLFEAAVLECAIACCICKHYHWCCDRWQVSPVSCEGHHDR